MENFNLDWILKHVWLFFVAFIGAVTGYMTKKQEEMTKGERVKHFLLGVVTSMFISYITYEIAKYFTQAEGLSVALAGLASFSGTDFAVALADAALAGLANKLK